MVCAASIASDQPAHTCSLIRAFASGLNILSDKLLTEHHLEFLSLKGGCIGSCEPTLVKMPHCWKSHVTAHLCNNIYFKCTADIIYYKSKQFGSSDLVHIINNACNLHVRYQNTLTDKRADNICCEWWFIICLSC